MTYLGTETSKHGGKPTELYKFEGTYANFFYTSGPKKVRFPDNINGDTYLPIAMRRSEINCGTQDDDGLDITIELAVSNELVQVYAFQDSPPVLDLTIYRFHNIAEPVQYWTGPINDIQVSNGVATIRSPSTLGAALDANIPNVFYQAPCNHVLFDARCKVSEEDWTEAATVVSVAGRVIRVNSVGTLDGKLVGGELQVASGERRMITAQNAGEIIVNFGFSQIAANDIVQVTAGCDLAYKGDCKTKFDNNRNFGGFPFIPAANPFQDGVDPAVVPLVDTTCLPQIFEGIFLTIVYTCPNPCNPNHTGNRLFNIHNVQPNGPGGVGVGGFEDNFGGLQTYTRELYENFVEGHPLLRGQLLRRYTSYTFNHAKMEYFFPSASFLGVTVFPSAFYCSPVGKDFGTGLVVYQYFDGAPINLGEKNIAGNSGADWGY